MPERSILSSMPGSRSLQKAGLSTIPVTYEGDAQVPDSLKGTLTVSPGFFSLTMETVHVDGKTYTTDVQSG